MSVGLDQFIGRGCFLPTVVMFLEYGLAVASSTYCLSFFFSDHTMAQVGNFFVLTEAFGISVYALCLSSISSYAECSSLDQLFNGTYSYGYIFHYGAY